VPNLKVLNYKVIIIIARPMAVKESISSTRVDGKLPDGLTLIPWKAGKPFTWVVTLTACYVAAPLYQPVYIVAEFAASRKLAKYANMKQSHICQPLTFENLCFVNEYFYVFISNLSAIHFLRSEFYIGR